MKITKSELRRIIRESLRDTQIQAERSTVIRARANQLFREGLTPAQVRTQLIEEGFGDFIRKGVNKLKQKTGMGLSDLSRDVRGKIFSEYNMFLEWCEQWFPTTEEFKAMIKVQQESGMSNSKADSSDVYYRALQRLPKKKQETLRNPNIIKKKIKQIDDFMEEQVDRLSRSDKTSGKVKKFYLELTNELEAKYDLVKGMEKAFREAWKSGKAEGVQRLIDSANWAAENARKAAGIALTKQENEERKERMNRKIDPKKNKDDDGEKMLSKSRHSENR